MDTTINSNLEADNSISDLTFYWKAKFTDQTEIIQYNDGIEHLFKEVQDRFDKLEYFYLIHKTLPIYFTVDLKKSIIYGNNHQSIEGLDLIKDHNNIRLIHTRIHRHKIGTADLKEKSHEIIYKLGLQWNDKSGNNRKIIFYIDKNGNWVVSN